MQSYFRGMSGLSIAWTTVANMADAERLSQEAVERGLAACVQVDGPIRSWYKWEGKLEVSEEFRLMFKFQSTKLAAIQEWLLAAHPYNNPEWVAVEADTVSIAYLNWAKD